MLERNQSLLPPVPHRGKLKTYVIGFDQASLEEMERLLTTLEVELLGQKSVTVRKISAATFIGTGKIEELKTLLETIPADFVVIDRDLSPGQLRNLEKKICKPTIDRSGVIIEIFSRHARTKESKTQVELARLEYLMPRLVHFWSHFERQRGGIGLKGVGEKQIEIDRRLLKKRMAVLRERLKSIEKERTVQRSGRSEVLKVALVGYTNAGKSTLLNGMTRGGVLAENKLFATLDSSVRALDPDSHPPIVAIDTVGFISQLPPALIASFRSTLEELHQADLLLHVVDASSPEAKEQMEVTEKILNEMGLEETPRLTILNKIDSVPRERLNWARLVSPGALRVSALSPEDTVQVRDAVLEHFRSRLEVWEVMVPYSQSRLESRLHALGSVEVTRHLEKGTFYRVRIDRGWALKLQLEEYRI